MDFACELRLGHHFRLGFQGYTSAFLWLVIPTFLFASLRRTEGPAALIVILGGGLLVLVLSWMPFLQVRLVSRESLASRLRVTKCSRTEPSCPVLLAVGDDPDVCTFAATVPDHGYASHHAMCSGWSICCLWSAFTRPASSSVGPTAKLSVEPGKPVGIGVGVPICWCSPCWGCMCFCCTSRN